MRQPPPMPVFVLTGFLGSGKTTLLNRLVRHANFSDSAIIVNEFGAIGLDHRLIATARDNIVLLDAGCLCCVMVDSLRETLADLYQRRATGNVPPFAQVLIETSGLADPAPILQTVMKDGVIAPLFRVGGVVTVVDAVHGRTQIAEHPEARGQIAMADRLVLAKAEHASTANLAALRGDLTRLNPTADIALIPPANASVAPLFDLDRLGTLAPLDARRHAVHDSDISSESFRIAAPVSWAGVAAWTAHLRERFGDDMLRCKALLPLVGGGQVLVQGVRRLFNIARADDLARPDNPSGREGVVICIGRHLDRELLHQGLAWLQAPEGTAFPPSRDIAPWAPTADR